MLSDSSGIAFPMSRPSVRPKPRQVGHAPIGLLKLNRPGVGAGSVMSQAAQDQSALKFKVSGFKLADSALETCDLEPETSKATTTFPLPNRIAASTASLMRARCFASSVTRSCTTITCTGSLRSVISSRRTIWPYNQMRTKPCACRKAAKSADAVSLGTETGKRMSAGLPAWPCSSVCRMLSVVSGFTACLHDGHVAEARRGNSILR